ncbi:TRAP transporter small permease subunit [Castellaniella sp.]
MDVLTRSVLRLTFFQSFELSSYAFAASVSLGLAFTLISRMHIRIEVVYVLFKPWMRACLDLAAILTLAGTAVVFAWFAFQTVWYSWSINSHSNTTLAMPLALPQGIWFGGLAWFAITAVWLFARAVLNLIRKRPQAISREIGVLALQEEIDQSEITLDHSKNE